MAKPDDFLVLAEGPDFAHDAWGVQRQCGGFGLCVLSKSKF